MNPRSGQGGTRRYAREYRPTVAQRCSESYLSEHADFAPFLELDHLRVMAAQPEYLLAMKCLAMRIGAEFHDEADVRYRLRHLDMDSYDRALAVIAKYYPVERFPQKTLHALEEILASHAEKK